MQCEVLIFYHVSASPTDRIGTTQGKRKTPTRMGIETTTFEFDHRSSTDWATRSDGSRAWKMKMSIARQWICTSTRKGYVYFKRWPCSWPCISVGGAAVIKPEGCGFNSHPGRGFPLSLCGPDSVGRASAHMVYGRKLALHIELYHSISLILLII